MPPLPRYVTSPHVIAYWDGGDLVLQNYAVTSKARGTRALGSIAHACVEPQSIDQIASQCPELARTTITGIVRLLLERRILYRAHRPLPAAERALARFGAWNPAAGFFHTSTKNVAYETGLDASPPPTGLSSKLAFARHYDPSGLGLPRQPPGGDFADVLLRRRTWRRFDHRPLTIDQVSGLLWLTLGVQQRVRLPDGTAARMRTSPSGGARHPIEACVAVRNVRGLTAGLYRYDSDSHRLHRRGGRHRRPAIDRYLPGQPWYRGAGIVVFFVARFARTRARYAHSRAYRAVLIEAGHLCQTFCLTATWLGLAPFSTMALADGAIETDLGLDGIEESVLYAAGVGHGAGPADECMVPVGAEPPAIIRRRLRTRT